MNLLRDNQAGSLLTLRDTNVWTVLRAIPGSMNLEFVPTVELITAQLVQQFSLVTLALKGILRINKQESVLKNLLTALRLHKITQD